MAIQAGEHVSFTGGHRYDTERPKAFGWKTIDSAPRDGTWVLLKGGSIDRYAWDGATQPPLVCAQFTHELNGSTRDDGRWAFAWYDGGYFGEYENPTHWKPLET